MNLVLSRQWRMNAPLAPDGLAIGIVPNGNASLGNVQAYGSAGMMLRIGSNSRRRSG